MVLAIQASGSFNLDRRLIEGWHRLPSPVELWLDGVDSFCQFGVSSWVLGVII